MAKLIWDLIEDRRYEIGIDRGVLYTLSGSAVVWNGLVAVTETGAPEAKSYYYQGRKVLERFVSGSYSGKIEAFTYPDVLDAITGIVSRSPGVRVHDSRLEPFHLTYRTRIGNPSSGIDYGYKIHLVYNLQAVFDDVASKTLGENIDPTLFSWTISGMQKYLKSGSSQPLDHISIDSRFADPSFLANLENQLYGTPTTAPVIPAPATLIP